MKKILNIILTISFITTVVLTIYLSYHGDRRVGDSKFDSKIDNPNFKVCNEDRILQYYNPSSTISYTGGTKAIRKEIVALLKKESISFENKSGYITFRFIVNCKRELGRFRVKMIDKNIKETQFDTSKINKLKTTLKALKNWESSKKKELTFDSYHNIKFKIENGVITDIF